MSDHLIAFCFKMIAFNLFASLFLHLFCYSCIKLVEYFEFLGSLLLLLAFFVYLFFVISMPLIAAEASKISDGGVYWIMALIFGSLCFALLTEIYFGLVWVLALISVSIFLLESTRLINLSNNFEFVGAIAHWIGR